MTSIARGVPVPVEPLPRTSVARGHRLRYSRPPPTRRCESPVILGGRGPPGRDGASSSALAPCARTISWQFTAARYRRALRHRGHQKALIAVAHAPLRAVYHLLANGTTFREPGADYRDRRHAERVRRRAIQMLWAPGGYRVVLESAAWALCHSLTGFCEQGLRAEGRAGSTADRPASLRSGAPG